MLHRERRASGGRGGQTACSGRASEHRLCVPAPHRPEAQFPWGPAARGSLPYQLAEVADGAICVQIDGKLYSVPEISSFVLQKIKAAAEDYLGEHVDEAVVAVPSRSDYLQRQAVRDAGAIAGLKVFRLVDASTAAALAYGLKNTKRQFVAVYDLGGGTFDISIVEMADGLFQVRAKGGDTFLGGEDFDYKITDWLITEFLRETGTDLRQNGVALQRLRSTAEKAKRDLSTAQQTEIVLPFISAEASGPKHLKTVLTRQKYESLTDDLLERTIVPCQRCMSDAGLRADQIDEVLLVGGQTRAPKVLDIVRKVFGKEPNRAVNPDEAIAMGAAIQTGILAGELKDLVLLDVTPHSLDIGRKGPDDGLFVNFPPLIPRQTGIPTRKTWVVTTAADNETRIELNVLESDSDMALYGTSLGKFEITNIPPAAKGVPQFEVTLEVDLNGIGSVSAEDRATGRVQSMTIHPSGGLSQSEVDRLSSETRQRQQQERAKKDHEAVVRQIDGVVANTMRSVEALQGRLTPDELRRILEAAERAKDATAGTDLEELKRRLQDMEKAATLIGQAMLRP